MHGIAWDGSLLLCTMMLRRERKPSLRVRDIQQAEEKQPLQIQIRKAVKCQKRLQQQAQAKARKRQSELLKERWKRLKQETNPSKQTTLRVTQGKAGEIALFLHY